MISEVLNALFLTFLVTEYLVATNEADPRGGGGRRGAASSWTGRLWRARTAAALGALVLVNVAERTSGAAAALGELLHRLLHGPKIVLVALAYVLALYWDCRRVDRSLRVPPFLRRVAAAFGRILPVYPFLAVLISFGFLVVINVFEFLHLPLEYLNRPIYYGTLYGPFSLVYWNVKRRVLDEASRLP